MVWGAWKTVNTSKDVLILIQEVFFYQCEKERFRVRVRVIVTVRVRGLTGRFAVTFNGDGPIESQKIQTLR